MNNYQGRGNSLRNQATQLLSGKPESGNEISTTKQEKLLEELRIHQIELKMQNEELRQVQENLEQSRAKYIDLYDCAPVGFLTLGEKGKILEANLTAAKLLGQPKKQLLKRLFSSFIEPEFQDAFYFHLRNLKKTGNRESCEVKLRKPDGESRYFQIESIGVSQAQKLPAQSRTTFFDIHEKKMLALALNESAERNELLLNLLPNPAILVNKDQKVVAANRMARKGGTVIDSSSYWDSSEYQISATAHSTKSGEFSLPHEFQGFSCLVDNEPEHQRLVTIVEDSNDAVSVIDLRGNIKAWNRRAEEIYGYPASEALKMSVFDLVPPGRKMETRTLLKDIASGVVVKPFETRRVARDGCILDVCLKVTRLMEGRKIVAIATTERDITDDNISLAMIQALPRRIIQTQEKERSRISQVIHSDFGQSLIALKLFVTMSAFDLPDEVKSAKPVFTKIKAKLDKIIKDARDLAHELSPPSLRYAGLVPAIKDLIRSANMQKRVSIRLFTRNIETISFKSKDIIIYRIIQEVLQNIIKHAHATRGLVKAIYKNSVFTLEVSDNGRGFETGLKRSASGLGIALMKEQAVLIHGTLSIESHAGKGTRIKLVVPIKEKKKS